MIKATIPSPFFSTKYGYGVHFNERKHWLNDDYVKFIRFAQYLVEKNGEGIVAFINPHGFLDNPTFRGMRWNLLKTFDKIYTIDLHGNSNKGEVSPDGSADQNVFDIKQGVSINLFVKTNKKAKNELAKVYHYDLFGKREFKYQFLINNSIKNIAFNELPQKEPMYFMVNKDFEVEEIYNSYFSLKEFFVENNIGIVTAKDSILINDNVNELLAKVSEFYKIDADLNKVQKIDYRTFDRKYIYYDNNYVERSREKLMTNFLKISNIGLVLKRQSKYDFSYAFLTNIIAESCLFESAFANNSICPLYLYQEPTAFDERERIPNFNPKILAEIEVKLGMKCVDDENFGKCSRFLVKVKWKNKR